MEQFARQFSDQPVRPLPGIFSPRNPPRAQENELLWHTASVRSCYLAAGRATSHGIAASSQRCRKYARVKRKQKYDRCQALRRRGLSAESRPARVCPVCRRPSVSSALGIPGEQVSNDGSRDSTSVSPLFLQYRLTRSANERPCPRRGLRQVLNFLFFLTPAELFAAGGFPWTLYFYATRCSLTLVLCPGSPFTKRDFCNAEDESACASVCHALFFTSLCSCTAEQLGVDDSRAVRISA